MLGDILLLCPGFSSDAGCCDDVCDVTAALGVTAEQADAFCGDGTGSTTLAKVCRCAAGSAAPTDMMVTSPDEKTGSVLSALSIAALSGLTMVSVPVAADGEAPRTIDFSLAVFLGRSGFGGNSLLQLRTRPAVWRADRRNWLADGSATLLAGPPSLAEEIPVAWEDFRAGERLDTGIAGLTAAAA